MEKIKIDMNCGYAKINVGSDSRWDEAELEMCNFGGVLGTVDQFEGGV